MITQLKEKINIKLYSSLLFSIALLVSCGGGGGGGGGGSSSGSGGFTISTIDSNGDVGWNTDIATGPNGSIHISYYDNTNGDLKYAYYNGSSWSVEIVDSAGRVGQYSSIAVESDGTVHISYYDSSSDDLKYATGTFGSWQKEIVDSTGDVGEYSSIAVDSNRAVHISYYDASTNVYNLKYATNSGVTVQTACSAGSTFKCETVDSTGDVGQYSSIAVDSNRTVHISYYDASTNMYDLKYATGTFGLWNKEIVDSTGIVGQTSSIAVDSNRAVHISYKDLSNGDLKYATNAGVTTRCSANSTFKCETVDSTGDVGDYSSIAVESNGTVHISYYDYDNENLKYASGTSRAFNYVTIDSTGLVGEDTSIAVAPDGSKVHISYYDVTNGNLKYAVK